jgi:hypothetical protein
MITPASAPPAAPDKFITKSLAPCDEALNAESTLSDKSAEPCDKSARPSEP